MKSRLVGARVVLALVVGGCSALVSTDATAVWPLPESATAEDAAKPENWPNDPGYAYCPSASPHCGDGNSNGQWNYYSFTPEQTSSSPLREAEQGEPSGMSTDLAWRYTIGQDAVRIAVMDSGIKWDEGDLLQRAWLNPEELRNFRPTESDGTTPCPEIVSGDPNVFLGYDCMTDDGQGGLASDGIFSAADYQHSASLISPPATGNNPLGDRNQNGVLDAGDIILNFSDGIDDDENGYVDDISGWDFMKDDNDPYDDTRYGHGTGEARDSVAEGNDGRGDIGGCPRCRFIAMRVGDSFIADVNAFAQAVIYATDNGAKVVQCALGTVNMNAFTQAALDYAYFNGVLNVTSMADENARHHNMPATANHTLPVHAIQYRGSRVTSTETFLDFNPCTNFGGQNLLSVPGTGCSSEAVGQLSGVSGLLFSEALEQDIELSAGEAMQLLIVTADDIDVPESRELVDGKAPYHWSQPGFDQRFGYGRVNASRAVEWIAKRKIPPIIDIVRPYWFETVYRDQLTGPIEIRGAISARTGATSYDYVVEWAPGVQPLDEDFVEIASETNIPQQTVTGGDEPITLFDVRTISTAHQPDIDSPRGENANTITVRIRAVAHYGGDIGDVPAIMHRTIAIHSDPDLVKGFPLYLGSSGEGSPKMADIDGDGVRDLLYPTTDGRLHVFKLTGDGPEYVDGFPFVVQRPDGLESEPGITGKPYYPHPNNGYVDGEVDDPADGVSLDLAGSSLSSAPAIADLDDDGTPEIVLSTWNGFIYVVEHDGTVRPGWPVRLPEVPSCPLDGSATTTKLCEGGEDIVDRGAFAAPVVEDMDGDGFYDIIQAAFDGHVYVFDRDGQPVEGWPVQLHYTLPLTPDEPGYNRILTTPAVGDFDGDGYPEILVGSNERLGQGDQSGAAYLIDGRGLTAGDEPFKENWPVSINSLFLFPLVAEGVTNSGVIGNFDGTIAGVVHGNASSPLIMPLDPGPQTKLNVDPPNIIPDWTNPDTGVTRPGLAATSRFGAHTKALRPDTMFPLFSNPSLGDIDQDGSLDVIASGSSLSLANSLLGQSAETGQQLLAIWNARTGNMLPGSPYVLEDYSFFNSHAVADLNGDDYPEVLVGSGGYFLHAYDGCGREPESWPKFTGQWIIPTPAVGDLDGDDNLEVAVGTRSGWLFVWRTKGRSDGQVQWESFHHDNRNTGNYEVPLEQGDPSRRAAEPMTDAFCAIALAGPASPTPLEPGGGCGSCAVGGEREQDRLFLLFGLGLVGLALRRRR